jgi:large repetitive protein
VPTNFQLQSPDVGKHGDFVVTATVSHAMNPLTLDAFMDGVFLNDHRVVERSTMFELGGAYAFLDRFEAGVRMPLYSQDGQPFGDPQQEFTTQPASGTAAGDLVLHAKARLWRGGSGSIATAVQMTLPTATKGEFTGTEKPSGRALVLAALNPDTLKRRITLTANFGAVLRAKSRFANIEQGGGATWGLGVSVRAFDRVWVAAEVFGDMLPSARLEGTGGDSVSLSPIEYLGGIRWLPDHRFAIGLAAGRGLTSAAGSPEVRGVLSLTFTPGASELPSLRDPEQPDIDSDGDGIRNRVDKCPEQAEDRDLFEDSDGCPDDDNDGDKVADGVDKCPLDPEDLDGFQDDDGCVDKDNDNDGLADGQDKCPDQPEDKDGFQDVDGCPDNDNDLDGIADGQDKCPAQPETINGNKDEDGCPDAGDSTIVLSPDRIETLDAVTFGAGNAKLTKQSFNILGQVGATMRAHPEIVRMRVTVHVQPSAACINDNRCDKDQELSDKRATAIRDWLVQWGVAEGRVEARGFGGTKTVVDPKQRGAALLNERVELIILERK